MKEIKINVPHGLQYLSDWDELDNLLPSEQHYILNKQLTGCGATEKFIRDEAPVIIAMPRKHLLYNKLSQHLNDNVFLYRFLDKKQYFSDKTPSEEQLKEFDRLLVDYLQSGGKKILTTYDSLPKIITLMSALGRNLNDFKVVVDEMQQILGDAPIKANIEHQFYMALRKFKTVIYLSATPFLNEYLDMSEQFNSIPVVKLIWDSATVKKTHIDVKKLTGSITKTCCGIIEKYKSGNAPTIKHESGIIQSKEAVFYLNDVGAIIDIIRKAGLIADEVNILCAPRRENIRRIEKLNSATQEKFEIGTIPGRGQANKMFTFCTSTVYIGSDFYSDNAYTYIFANPNVQSLCLDVSTDLQQILGRQRSEANPFRNMADLYYHLKKPLITQEQNEEMIKQKKQETQKQIENYLTAKHPDSMLRTMEAFIEKSSHKDQYCCISEDEHGNKTIVENSLIWIAERRAWDIANKVYSGDFSLFEALRLNSDIKQEIDTDDVEVRKVFERWSKDSKFKRRAMLYCDIMENTPDLMEKCTFIPKCFHEYYEALGRKGMEELQWRADYIKQALAPTPIDEMPHEEIYEMLVKSLAVGNEYTKEKVKDVMVKIYKSLSIKGKPSATDCSRYITIEEYSKRINKRKVAMIRVRSHYRTGITLFSRITDVKNPQFFDIDHILNVIKTGKDFNIADRVNVVRTAVTKVERDRAKFKLPAIAWNGRFKYRDKSGCELYSSFTALDFDHIGLDNMKDFKSFIHSFPCVYSYFKSPGGDGMKVIIVHDSQRKENHADLYAQLLTLFKCDASDTSTSDLGRGNYLSYDPDLWINPSPEPFHYIPSRTPAKDLPAATQTIVEDEAGHAIFETDDDYTSSFLNYLSKNILTDDSIINMLNKKWNQATIDRGRNNTALSYAGVLCKAGVEKNKAQQFIQSLLTDLPTPEITRAIKYAYEHNIFGSHRRLYLKKRRS
ncbi:MAG: BT4734/BF3469 family protein [Bacteroidales bacterium]|nr:BT4734/BF3469 family protein [Bacteroidales bacterium]